MAEDRNRIVRKAGKTVKTAYYVSRSSSPDWVRAGFVR
jgi:hypothetical protein